ncbi:site-specific integrase [Mycobacterium hackensackense]|uniref:tyrosine-type recombinase/integrase n=1 Tax=Mycobacterium hackensackense TaxID=228909 RepID=UPI002265BA18|nr:site-specific integrase [Mycobacterium hackensackense]MCV7255254.1 site-specific integrase [Mycobacterium hackensackense]
MASVRARPRKDGTFTYAALFTIDGRQSSLPFDDRKAAEAFCTLVNNVGATRALEIHNIEPGRRRADTPTGLTVGQWLTRHIDHLTGVEQKTIDDYRRYVRRDLPMLADIPLAALTEEDVALWVKHLESTGGRGGRGNSPKSIANKHGFLSGALSAAVPKHIPANPAAGRRLPRAATDVDDEMRMLSRDEFELLVESTTEYWRPLMEFLVVTGCRWGEASALKPTDVDRRAGTVRIRRAWKYSSTKGYEIGPPKTKRSRRIINVDSSVLDQLDYSGEWLFTNSGRGARNAGGPVRYSNFRANVWDKAVARAGLDPAPTPHDLRHTCASWMLNGGIPPAVVSRHLGHESIQVTVDIYGEVDRTSSRAAADFMAGMLRDPENS